LIVSGFIMTTKQVKEYSEFWTKNNEETLAKRKEEYTTVVNDYYDLVTLFYEYGWGQSFHFAPQSYSDTMKVAISRHEHYLALRMNLKADQKVLDVGCGVGGPLIEISRFSGARITGLNNNAFQISRGQAMLKKAGLQDRCSFLKADFLHVPLPDNSFDAIYAIEATCHSPSKLEIYSEIYRLLKPGSYFAAYEWCMTDKYDPNNREHNEIKFNIELGDGLPNLDNSQDVLNALKEAKFNVLDFKDLAVEDEINPVPWYSTLAESYFSLTGVRFTPLGRAISGFLLSSLEKIRLAPPGSRKAHEILLTAANGLSRGGKLGIFTPMLFFLVQKPLQ